MYINAEEYFKMSGSLHCYYYNQVGATKCDVSERTYMKATTVAMKKVERDSHPCGGTCKKYFAGLSYPFLGSKCFTVFYVYLLYGPVLLVLMNNIFF